MNANRFQISARESTITSALLQSMPGAKTMEEIAQQLGVGWRTAIHHRAVAGVRPAFTGPSGTPYYSAEDVEKIRQAKEAAGPLRYRGLVDEGTPQERIETVGTDI